MTEKVRKLIRKQADKVASWFTKQKKEIIPIDVSDRNIQLEEWRDVFQLFNDNMIVKQNYTQDQ